MSYYKAFQNKNIDLTPLGISQGEDYPYFCTPAGAKIIGWAGVDGIHYIFIHGFKEMVFAVSPMNSFGDYVHPIARSFKDFLSLLTAVGDASVLDQTVHLSQEAFNKLSKEAQAADQSAIDAIDAIKSQCRLPFIPDPYYYIKSLQSEFDYSRLRFTEDYYDLDMNPSAIVLEPWEVYFGCGFYGKPGKRIKPCREISVGKGFEFMSAYHFVPAVYVGSEGIIADICVRAEKADVQAFLDSFNAAAAEAGGELNRFKEREFEQLNPLNVCENATLVFNCSVLRSCGGYSLVFSPCINEGERQDIYAEAAVKHYGLDESCGWCIWRHEFRWTDKPSKKILDACFNLSIRLESRPRVYSTDAISFKNSEAKIINPVSGREHTITICQSKREAHDFNLTDGFDHPNFATQLSYTVTPDLPDTAMRLCDMNPADPSRPSAVIGEKGLYLPQARNDAAVAVIGGADGPAAVSAEAIGIIGGADGPTAVFISRSNSEPERHIAISSLSFDENKDVRWMAVFTDNSTTADEITLLP